MEIVYGIIAIVAAFATSVFFKNRKIADLSTKLADTELKNKLEKREELKKDVENAKNTANDARSRFDTVSKSWRPGDDSDPAA